MLHLRYVRCDVFSHRPFGGNPLAVFTDGRGLNTSTMQAIALEMNLSETVFVLPPTSGGTAKIRIFTPRVELGFAGHPTLGAAFVLGRPLQSDRLCLETGMGLIQVQIEREGATPRAAWLELPLPQVEDQSDGERLLRALGLPGAVTPIRRYSFGITHVLVQLEHAAEVASLKPDFAALAQFGKVGIVVFAHDAGSVRARVFVPGVGVAEDPATGSAVAPIALHLYQHGRLGEQRDITISQGQELGRPSELKALLKFDGEHLAEVQVGGECVVLGRGEWQLPGRVA
jgi:trans-2,3-dihydro-3-hydroxyanthranilate isomerase